jgi:hypothetical protein
MATDSPWYGPSCGRDQIPQERMRIPWPRWLTIPKLAEHCKEKSSPPPSHPHARRHPPLPCGQKSPMWGQVARTNRKAVRPLLGGISTSVHRSRASTMANPHLEAKKRPREGETREAKSPLVPSPPHQKTQVY